MLFVPPKSPNAITAVLAVMLKIISTTSTSINVKPVGCFTGFKLKLLICIPAEATRLSKTIRLIRYHAVLENTPYRLTFSKNNYQIARLNTNDEWKMVNERHLKSRTFNDKTEVYLETGFHKKSPIFIQSTGEITPFKLTFFKQKKQQEPLATLQVKQNGTIEVAP